MKFTSVDPKNGMMDSRLWQNKRMRLVRTGLNQLIVTGERGGRSILVMQPLCSNHNTWWESPPHALPLRLTCFSLRHSNDSQDKSALVCAEVGVEFEDHSEGVTTTQRDHASKCRLRSRPSLPRFDVQWYSQVGNQVIPKRVWPQKGPA